MTKKLTKDIDVEDVRGSTPEQVFSFAGVAALVVATDVPDFEPAASVKEVDVALVAVVGDWSVLEMVENELMKPKSFFLIWAITGLFLMIYSFQVFLHQ